MLYCHLCLGFGGRESSVYYIKKKKRLNISLAVSGSFHFKAQFKSKFLCIVIRHFEMTNLFCDWSHVEFVGDFFFPCQKLLWYVFVNTLWINNLIDVSLWFSFGCLMFYSVCTVKLQMSDNVLFVFLLSAHVSNCVFLK